MSLGIGAEGVGRGPDAVQAEHGGIPDNPACGNHPTSLALQGAWRKGGPANRVTGNLQALPNKTPQAPRTSPRWLYPQKKKKTTSMSQTLQLYT